MLLAGVKLFMKCCLAVMGQQRQKEVSNEIKTEGRTKDLVRKENGLFSGCKMNTAMIKRKISYEDNFSCSSKIKLPLRLANRSVPVLSFFMA